MKSACAGKNWWVVFKNGIGISVAYGNAKAYAEQKKHEGATRRCYRTLKEAIKAMEIGPDYRGDEPPPLF